MLHRRRATRATVVVSWIAGVGMIVVSTLAFASAQSSTLVAPKPVFQETSPSAAELAQQQAACRFRHELVADLSRQNDARQLLAAASFAHATVAFGSAAADIPEALRYTALLQRAQDAGADVPLVWWMTATQDCKGTCTTDAAVQRLIAIDGDNAATWVLEFNRAHDAGDVGAARAALSRAAQARRFDDHMFELEKILLQAALSGPPVQIEAIGRPPGLNEAAAQTRYRLEMSIGISIAMVMPPLMPLLQTCTQKGSATPDPDLRADCLAIGKTMASGATSSLAWRFGLRLSQMLADEGLQKAQVQRQLRDSDWLMQESGFVSEFLIEDSAGVDRFVGLLLQSQDEVAFARSLAKLAGASENAPEDRHQPALSAGVHRD